MVIRYAYVVDDETLWGPGPMPYFITLTNGTAWEITAHTKEENEAVGIYVVEQINYREYDDRFETVDDRSYAVINGLPTETWSYTFIPAAKINMQFAVDEHAELLRTQVATKFPGQYAEYDQAYAEAMTVMNLPENEKIAYDHMLDATASFSLNEDFPYVAADIGITYSPILERTVETIIEAAELIVRTRDDWKKFGASLRTARLAAKKNIKDASTDQEAKAIYDAFVATTIIDYIPV
jgi:hypothetical protein